MDESITIGSQKLLLILGIPAQHLGRALRHEDVKVLGLFVSSSWKAEEVKRKFLTIAKEIGHSPEYTLSDNGHNLVNASELAELPHHADISHTFGIILKDAYADAPEFNEFVTLMGKARLSYHLTDKAYLLPPNQRAICRFMNFFEWVDWARKLTDAHDKLSEEEQKAFKFVKDHKSLIYELYPVMKEHRFVEKKIKQEGLSRKNVDLCVKYIIKNLMSKDNPNLRMGRIAAQMCLYLQKEAELLKSDEDIHNVSSDIIEVTYGLYKYR